MTDLVNQGYKSPSCFSSDHENWDNQYGEVHPRDTVGISHHRSSGHLKAVANNDKNNSQFNCPRNIMGEHVLQSESNRESISQHRESMSNDRDETTPEIVHKNNNEEIKKSQPHNNTEQWQGEHITPHDSVEGPWKLPPGLAEELMELQETNEALKGLLRRNNGKGLAEIHYRLEKTERSVKEKNAMLKEERDNHKKTESKFIEYKSQAQKIIHDKDTEIKKLIDINHSIRAESAVYQARLKESDSILQIVKTENMRLLQLCKQNNVIVHAYTDNTNGKTVRQERVQAAVPSTKKNYLKMSHGAYPNECVSVPRNKSSNKEDRPTTPNNRYTRGSQISSISGNGFRYDSASPNSQYTSASTITNDVRTQSGDVLYVGQETTWKGLTGVIRYIGPVDELHRGTWIGVEFDEGRGEHSGNILGIHYFSAAPRSSVFCRPEELGPSRVKVSNNLGAVKKDVRTRIKSPGRPLSRSITSENKSGDYSKTNMENTKEKPQTPNKGDDLPKDDATKEMSGSWKVPPPPTTMKRSESVGAASRGKTGHHDSEKKKTPVIHHVVEMNIKKEVPTSDLQDGLLEESSKEEVLVKDPTQEEVVHGVSLKDEKDQEPQGEEATSSHPPTEETNGEKGEITIKIDQAYLQEEY